MYPNTYSKKTRALHAQSVLHTYRGKHFKKSNPGGRLRIRKNYWALARNVLTARLSRLQACRNIWALWGFLPTHFLNISEGLTMPTLQAFPHLIWKPSVGPRLCYASAKFLVPSLQQLTSRPSGCYRPPPPSPCCPPPRLSQSHRLVAAAADADWEKSALSSQQHSTTTPLMAKNGFIRFSCKDCD